MPIGACEREIGHRRTVAVRGVPATVCELAIAPVKGVRLCSVDALQLGPAGALGGSTTGECGSHAPQSAPAWRVTTVILAEQLA